MVMPMPMPISSISASSSVTGHALRDETHVRHSARTWRSLTRDEMHVRNGVRVYIPSTCSELSTGWSVWKRTDVHLRREPSQTCCVLIPLVVEPSVASSQQSVERGSTLGRSGRVVATRRPVSGGAWYVLESSRTSEQSAGSGDLRDRRSTADTCLVLLRGVGSPGARVSSGDLCEIVGWQWKTTEHRRTFSCPV